MRRGDFFRIFNFDREVCEKLIQKVSILFLAVPVLFLAVPVLFLVVPVLFLAVHLSFLSGARLFLAACTLLSGGGLGGGYFLSRSLNCKKSCHFQTLVSTYFLSHFFQFSLLLIKIKISLDFVLPWLKIQFLVPWFLNNKFVFKIWPSLC